MSLELALKQNTEALNRVSELLEQLRPSTVASKVDEVQPVQIATAEDEAPTESEPVVESVAEPEAPTRTRDDVKDALFAVAKKSRDDLAAILAKFNVANISAIKESDFEEVIRLADEALETANA